MAGKRDEADFKARRAVLLDTAAELFAAEGLHNVSLRQIGWALGRTPGVFGMFDGKQDVVRALIDRQLDDLLAAVGAAAETPDLRAPARLVAMARAYADTATAKRHAHLVLRRETCRLPVLHRAMMAAKLAWLQTLFQDMIETAHPWARLDPPMSLMLAESLVGVLDTHLDGGVLDAADRQHLAHVAVAMIASPGVCRIMTTRAQV